MGRLGHPRWLGSRVSPPGRHRSRRRIQPKPHRHGGMRPSHEQSSLGGGPRKRRARCTDHTTAKRLGRKRFTALHARPKRTSRTHRQALTPARRSDSCGRRCGSWSLSPREKLPNEHFASGADAAQGMRNGRIRNCLLVCSWIVTIEGFLLGPHRGFSGRENWHEPRMRSPCGGEPWAT